jgi:hypothetical protein
MSWARLDDGFHDHPKVDGLSLAAVGLYTLCLTWAHRHRKTAILHGHISEARVRKVAGKQGDALASELVVSGLWEIEPNIGGYVIHDFADYLPKERDPQERREAGRKGAARRWQTDSKPDGNLPSNSMANPMASDSSRASAPASPTRTEQPTVVLPDPTRPVPTTSDVEAVAADVGALVGEFIDHCRQRPPSAFISRIGKEVRALALDGTEPEAIRGGLAIVADRGLQPTALAGAVHEHMNARSRQAATSRNAQILQANMAAARAAEERREIAQ